MTTISAFAGTSIAPSSASRRRPPTRSTRDDIRTIPSLLRGELIKLTSVRSALTLVAITVLGGLLVSWAVAAFVTDEVLYVAEVGFYWTVVTAVLASIGGVLLFTSEVQHGTLAGVVAAHPARWALSAAKTISAAAMGLVLGIAGLLVGFAGAAITDIDAGNTAAIPATCAWAVLFTVLSAVLGLGLGMIARHSATAVAALLVWGFVIENLLNLFMPAAISRFLPFLAGNRLLGLESDLDSPASIAAALSRTQNAVVFGGYAIIALALGTTLLCRRDPS